jgi:hypothetical protein
MRPAGCHASDRRNGKARRSRRHYPVVIPEPLPEANSPPNVRKLPLGLQIYVEAVGIPKLEAGLGVALVWLWGSLGVALVWLWGSLGVALVWLWCGLEVAWRWLWCGLGVALYSGVYA